MALLRDMVYAYKDIRNQIDDLELNAHPELSSEEHNRLLDEAIWMMQGLALGIISRAASYNIKTGYEVFLLAMVEFGPDTWESDELSSRFWHKFNDLLDIILTDKDA